MSRIVDQLRKDRTNCFTGFPPLCLPIGTVDVGILLTNFFPNPIAWFFRLPLHREDDPPPVYVIYILPVGVSVQRQGNLP